MFRDVSRFVRSSLRVKKHTRPAKSVGSLSCRIAVSAARASLSILYRICGALPCGWWRHQFHLTGKTGTPKRPHAASRELEWIPHSHSLQAAMQHVRRQLRPHQIRSCSQSFLQQEARFNSQHQQPEQQPSHELVHLLVAASQGSLPLELDTILLSFSFVSFSANTP